MAEPGVRPTGVPEPLGDTGDDGDDEPAQLPVIVPNSVQSGGESLNGEIAAVVSITRVPAKIKTPEHLPPAGIKVRTDLGAPRPGPPPLLRVAGPARPSLPPMPRLKLGGMRGTGPVSGGPRFSPGNQMSQMNGMMGMMRQPMGGGPGGFLGQHRGHLVSPPMSQLASMMQQSRPRQSTAGMPVISGSMSLRQIRPKSPAGTPRMTAGTPRMTRPGMGKQRPSFMQQTSVATSRPVQVRTVFVPPPMKMKGSGLTPSPGGGLKHSPGGGPKVINSFPLNVTSPSPQPSSPSPGISITPLSNGKTNGNAPVIKGVDVVNGNSGTLSTPTDDTTYDDVELDEDDDGVDENDMEYNEITETTDSSTLMNGTINQPNKVTNSQPNKVTNSQPNKVTNNPPSEVANNQPQISNQIPKVTSPRKVSTDSQPSSLDSVKTGPKAKKSFKGNNNKGNTNDILKLVMSSKEPKVIKREEIQNTNKRPLDMTSEIDSSSGVKRAKLTPVHVKTEETTPVKKYTQSTNCLCNEAPVQAQPTTSICQAVEVVGGHRVGCKNKISNPGFVYKLGGQGSEGSLCGLHTERLRGHGCCPYCGEFCSHGLVYMCRHSKGQQPHMFHRACYQARSKDERCCPHCGSRRSPLAVQLKLTMSQTPMQFLQYTSKMSGPNVNKNKEDLGRWETGRKREAMVKYKLPNGRVLSAEGLPKGLEPDVLENILRNFDNKSAAKCTTRNMYVPTSAGDNVKLLQLLALDYSPRQKFPEADGGTPLHVAAGANHTLTAHILIQAGAEIDAFDDNNETPLMIAAYNGYPETVRYLITAGARIDLKSDDGMTSLHLATQNGHLECAHIILGSNNLPRNHINVKDDGGWTPLVWACEHKHEAVIRYLLEQGADSFTTDVELNVALHWASFSGSKSIVELLISAGCNVNQANAIGETPLHIALRQDHYECALLLITRGARLDIANTQGQLPAHCISEESNRAASLVQLGTTLQKLMNERKQKFLTERTVCLDISNGKENIPVTAINGEDFEQGPSGYIYVRNNVVTSALPIDRNISTLQHCRCRDNCTSEETCKCSDNSVRSWYDQAGILKEGFDFNDPPMIFECNDMCSCNVSSCNNRVVQHGITARMQLYKTYGMGWGVKALVDIQKGGFVCEYVGELISDAEAEQRENDSYLFDLENRDGETFCIDANKFGNVTRFINHSCAPNLVPVKVFSQHQDLRFPHIAMFASRDIKKGEVLGFDYGEKFWVIKHKYFTCWCGLDKCKYSKTAIGKTLEAYYKKLELSKSPVEEEQKQTGKLKLKLRMEEGKVVKVDDSGLLPDEPDSKKDDRKSPVERGKVGQEDGKSTESQLKEEGKKGEGRWPTPDRMEKSKKGGKEKEKDDKVNNKDKESKPSTKHKDELVNNVVKEEKGSAKIKEEKDEKPTLSEKEANVSTPNRLMMEVKKTTLNFLQSHMEKDEYTFSENEIQPQPLKTKLEKVDKIAQLKVKETSNGTQKDIDFKTVDKSISSTKLPGEGAIEDRLKSDIIASNKVLEAAVVSTKRSLSAMEMNKEIKRAKPEALYVSPSPAPLDSFHNCELPIKSVKQHLCSSCNRTFLSDNELSLHIGDCLARYNLTKKCLEVSNVPVPTTDTNSHHQYNHTDDLLADKKTPEKNVAITIINEDNVDKLKDTKTIEGKIEKDPVDNVLPPIPVEPPQLMVTPQQVGQPTPPAKKRPGRPRKIAVPLEDNKKLDNSIVESPKRPSNSSSKPLSDINISKESSPATSAASKIARPKRSRKAIDKDL